MPRNIEQFKKEKKLSKTIEQIKKNSNLLQNKFEQFKKRLKKKEKKNRSYWKADSIKL